MAGTGCTVCAMVAMPCTGGLPCDDMAVLVATAAVALEVLSRLRPSERESTLPTDTAVLVVLETAMGGPAGLVHATAMEVKSRVIGQALGPLYQEAVIRLAHGLQQWNPQLTARAAVGWAGAALMAGNVALDGSGAMKTMQNSVHSVLRSLEGSTVRALATVPRAAIVPAHTRTLPKKGELVHVREFTKPSAC